MGLDSDVFSINREPSNEQPSKSNPVILQVNVLEGTEERFQAQ